MRCRSRGGYGQYVIRTNRPMLAWIAGVVYTHETFEPGAQLRQPSTGEFEGKRVGHQQRPGLDILRSLRGRTGFKKLSARSQERWTMTVPISRSVILTLAILLSAVPRPQGQGGTESQVRQQVAQLKQTIAQNRAQLQKYQWIEATQVSIKGETKKEEEIACHYGPDGKLVKTTIGVPPQPKELPGGLRGKVAKKKIAEMKDYMDRLKALIGHYAPPDSERMQASYRAGKANLNLSSGGLTSLTFHDYYKPGDTVTFGFDNVTKKLTSYDVNTYLDGPSDVVTLANQFATLPDNTNYLQQTILTSKSKQIEIRKTNSQYNQVSP